VVESARNPVNKNPSMSPVSARFVQLMGQLDGTQDRSRGPDRREVRERKMRDPQGGYEAEQDETNNVVSVETSHAPP